MASDVTFIDRLRHFVHGIASGGDGLPAWRTSTFSRHVASSITPDTLTLHGHERTMVSDDYFS
jgi:hypothetical protein